MVVHIFQPARQTMNVNESDMPNATKASAGVASSGDEGNEELSDAISMSFPQKLMEILRNSRTNDIISWLPHGKAFIIYKKKAFVGKVLNKYFKQSKFTSFTRKLNRWKFVRITRGPDTGAYFHQFFVRDDPHLCLQMCCQNIRLQNEAKEKKQQQQALAVSSMPFGMSLPMSPLQHIQQQANATTSTAVLNSTFLQQQMLEQLQQQQQYQQRQEQLQLQQQHYQQQQEQQLQTAEMLRRAIAFNQGSHQQQASASLDAANAMDQTSSSYHNINNIMMDQASLYMELFQNKWSSSLDSLPLIQNSAPGSVVAEMQQKQSAGPKVAVPIEDPRKSGVSRASAA